MPRTKTTHSGFVVVGTSTIGARYWYFTSDVDAAIFIRYMRRTHVDTPGETYEIKRTWQTQYEG